MLSAVAETGLELSYLTHGQRVPEDIKMATSYQLIEQFSEQEKLLHNEANPLKATRGQYVED
ncbi:flagellar biosynthesis regulator FlhF [Legionella clemsonensis]|uniref:Flagellar biosynthesis regulator FlhF n=1 Tax=Legionella clemsonensis TaxID=1867846 RepID=A0A222P0L9_9GAMM|nr:hypothetical protein [Legionella clemsonensis]ASQ45376.1 flagellar biosynthesis regulator FlhF [Legionella clemsonensis]